jgi:predicted Zn-dependent peptidase
MQSIATQEIYYGDYYSPSEIIREIDSVSISKAREVSERYIKGKGIALTVLGPVEEFNPPEDILAGSL